MQWFTNVHALPLCLHTLVYLHTYMHIFLFISFIPCTFSVAILTFRLHCLIAWAIQSCRAEITIGIDQWVYCYNLQVNGITAHPLKTTMFFVHRHLAWISYLQAHQRYFRSKVITTLVNLHLEAKIDIIQREFDEIMWAIYTHEIYMHTYLHLHNLIQVFCAMKLMPLLLIVKGLCIHIWVFGHILQLCVDILKMIYRNSYL